MFKTCLATTTPRIVVPPNHMSTTAFWSINFGGDYYVFKKAGLTFPVLVELISALCANLFKPGARYYEWISEVRAVLRHGPVVNKPGMSVPESHFLSFLANRASTNEDTTLGKFHGQWKACDKTLVFSEFALLGVCMIFASFDEPMSFTIAVAEIPPELTIPTTPTTHYSSEVAAIADALEQHVSPFLDVVG